MDAMIGFNISYQANEADNKTATAYNTALKPIDGTATVATDAKSNDTLTFTITWGPDNHKSYIAFTLVMDDKTNMTSLTQAFMFTYQTKANGFVNASSPGAEVNRTIDIKDVSWPSSGGYMCHANQPLPAMKQGMMTLTGVKIQVFHGDAYIDKDLADCDADKSTTVAPKTTTTTAPPAPIKTYGVLNAHNKYCILLTAAVSFRINYKKTDNTTAIVMREVPAHGVTTTGDCDIGNMTQQRITLNFNDTWKMDFFISNTKALTKLSNNGDGFSVFQLNLTGLLDSSLNATRHKSFSLFNKVNQTTGDGAFAMFLNAPTNKSVNCSEYKQTLGTIDHDDVSISVMLYDVQFQAFGDAKDKHSFFPAQNCKVPGNDLVPIIVGASLAALVIIVLVAYLIGRARARRTGYQSV